MTATEMVFYLSQTFHQKMRFEATSEKRLYVRVQPEDLREGIRYVFEDREGRLSTATGIDTREGIEVMYHFSFNGFPLITTIRVTTPKHMPELDSVQDILKGAYWIEREIHDFFGVVFKGHPKLKRLFKSRDIPENIYPLRKDFELEKFRENKDEA